MKPDDLPDEATVQKAFDFLKESEGAFSQAFAAKEASEQRLKIARDVGFMEAAGTVAERQAIAGASEAVTAAVDRLEEAYTQFKLLEAKRKRAEMTFEFWRTLEASRRRG